MTTAELAARLEGDLRGDAATPVIRVAEPGSAGPDNVVFCMSRAQRDAVVQSRAGVIVCGRDVALETDRPVIAVDNPRLAMARTIRALHPFRKVPAGVAAGATVDATARLGQDVTVLGGAVVGPEVEIGDETVIHPGTVIMAGVKIGSGCLIYPNVTLCEGVVVGNRVILHPGVVIGADGFGYAQDGMRIEKIPQVGIVRIGDDVEIGANTTIDRATLGETVIGASTKIDNLVQIGHNVKIGRGCIIVAQTGIAGSVDVGDGVILGGQVGVADHVRIGAGAKVASQSGIAKDIPAGEVWSGSPAIPHRRWLRASRLFSELPDLAARLGKIERTLTRDTGPDEEEER